MVVVSTARKENSNLQDSGSKLKAGERNRRTRSGKRKRFENRCIADRSSSARARLGNRREKKEQALRREVKGERIEIDVTCQLTDFPSRASLLPSYIRAKRGHESNGALTESQLNERKKNSTAATRSIRKQDSSSVITLGYTDCFVPAVFLLSTSKTDAPESLAVDR